MYFQVQRGGKLSLVLLRGDQVSAEMPSREYLAWLLLLHLPGKVDSFQVKLWRHKSQMRKRILEENNHCRLGSMAVR